MTRRARLAVLLAVVVAIALWLTACAPPDADTSPGYVSGDGAVTEWAVGERPGPLELTGTGIDGSALDVTDYRGEVVVVTTWYATCPPCRAEAPDLVELDAVDGVSVLGVNVRDDADTAKAFERTFGVEYPSLNGADGTAIAQLQGLVAVRAVPTALILDPDGYVAARAVGRIEPSTLRALVDAASGGDADAPTDGAEAPE
ncbi:TlpA disulfide reductase family protein [Demequina sp.]|uniref:TlpA family protein disulfide reductase n=1 Tax=Demequina sp. TaxID=2050685 RepID=UPI0025BF8F99|nr:TlpA disulfide reductase family protein [Demequina sp.]